MAMRLAAVSTPSGAIPEIIDDGVNGLLIPSNDEGALADALIILAQDPVLRQRLGRAAREKIQSRFDIARNMDHYATLFRNNV
jgi:glycosyltransferase involved in cell wall biosynthesis